MKKHTTIKFIKGYFNKVFYCGYCDLYYIFKYEDPQFYNSGVYGWNCDIYTDYKRDIAITTGYRNMTGKQIPHELIKKYTDIAKEIDSQCFKVPFDEIKKALDENRENFLNELNSL